MYTCILWREGSPRKDPQPLAEYSWSFQLEKFILIWSSSHIFGIVSFDPSASFHHDANKNPHWNPHLWPERLKKKACLTRNFIRRFPKNGGTPIAGWFISWNLATKNGWWLGVPSGKLLHNYGLNHHFVAGGLSSISIFHSSQTVGLPEGMSH